MNLLTKNSSQTIELGKKLGQLLRPGMVLALEGDLGGGKTTFTKGLALGLGITDDITSPSFTLEKIYKTNGTEIQTLYHFDFYRIGNLSDMINYELSEALSDKLGVVVVEWAEMIEKTLPDEKLIVRFKYNSEEEREVELIPEGEIYQKIVAESAK